MVQWCWGGSYGHFEVIKQSVRKHTNFILESVLFHGAEAALLHLLFEGQENYPGYRILGCVSVLCGLVGRNLLSTSSVQNLETACSCKNVGTSLPYCQLSQLRRPIIMVLFGVECHRLHTYQEFWRMLLFMSSLADNYCSYGLTEMW